MMRVLQAALLAGIPVAGLAAGPLMERLQSPRQGVDIEMVAPTMAISGAPARASVLSAALDGLAGSVELQTVECSEAVETEARQARYSAGVRRSDNPEHVAASEVLQRELALLAELEAEARAVSAEIAALSAQRVEQEELVAGIAQREAALRSDWQRAAGATAEAAERVARSAEAADELRRRAAHREALYAEIADLQARLPGLQAAVAEARVTADAVDLEAIEQESARSAGLVEAKQRGVKAARQQLKQARRDGGDVEASRAALKDARGQLAQAEDRLSVALAAAISAEEDLARAEETRRHLLHASTALRSAQDELSAAPGHCSILAAEADKLPRLERKLGHREAEERSALIAMERAGSLHRQQAEGLAGLTEALRAQQQALAALEAGIVGQSRQVAQAEGARAGIPARLSRTIRRDVDYPVETWTRSCEVLASVQWTDAAGVLRAERLTGLAVTSDVASPGALEAGIAADLRVYPLDDDALIRQADLALADDIRALIGGDALAGGFEHDTGR